MKEIWKQFEEVNGKQYLVSNKGNVKNIDTETGKETFMPAGRNLEGRRNITLNGKYILVYRLVAEAFIPNPENKPTVNHIRGLDAGDGVDNLEWATYAEQDEHARKTGLKTPGNTPAIVLDSNGYVMSEHETMTEAFKSYDGRNAYYNKYTRIVGNAIIMTKSYYDELSENDLDKICFECFERMVEFFYVVDGNLVDNVRQTAEMVDYKGFGTLYTATNDKWSANIKGHTVSRLKNKIGVHRDDSKEEPIYEQITIK